MTDVIAEQGAAIDGVNNPDITVSRLGGAGHIKNAIARAIADGTASATASRLGAQGRIYALAGGGDISPGLPGGSVWTPAALFASSEVGAWYDPSDLSTMFQDSAGTTPVTATGDPVGLILDKSGNGKHASQATAASRPVYRDVGGYRYLEFDGTDDSLVTAAIDLSATDKISVWAGQYKASDATLRKVFEFYNSSNAGSFYLGSPRSALTHYSIYSRGATGAVDIYVNATHAAPITNTLSAFIDLSAAADESKLYVNGVKLAESDAVDSGGGNFTNQPLYIGSRLGTIHYMLGNLYGLILRGVTSSTDEITATEAYMNGKTGAY